MATTPVFVTAALPNGVLRQALVLDGTAPDNLDLCVFVQPGDPTSGYGTLTGCTLYMSDVPNKETPEGPNSIYAAEGNYMGGTYHV